MRQQEAGWQSDIFQQLVNMKDLLPSVQTPQHGWHRECRATSQTLSTTRHSEIKTAAESCPVVRSSYVFNCKMACYTSLTYSCSMALSLLVGTALNPISEPSLSTCVSCCSLARGLLRLLGTTTTRWRLIHALNSSLSMGIWHVWANMAVRSTRKVSSCVGSEAAMPAPQFPMVDSAMSYWPGPGLPSGLSSWDSFKRMENAGL
jgi:hypothetical protein